MKEYFGHLRTFGDKLIIFNFEDRTLLTLYLRGILSLSLSIYIYESKSTKREFI